MSQCRCHPGPGHRQCSHSCTQRALDLLGMHSAPPVFQPTTIIFVSVKRTDLNFLGILGHPVIAVAHSLGMCAIFDTWRIFVDIALFCVPVKLVTRFLPRTAHLLGQYTTLGTWRIFVNGDGDTSCVVHARGTHHKCPFSPPIAVLE